MSTVAIFQAFFAEFAPSRLAESWDNVGLLVGNPQAEVRRLMTCLSVTPTTVEEAVESHANLIVSHHPVPFSPIKRLTSDTIVGQLLLKLIAARIAVYSPHTAFDSAAEGINQRLAEGLNLTEIRPLVLHEEGQGAGRWGKIVGPLELRELACRLMSFLGVTQLQIVGKADKRISTVAVACGAAGEFLESARKEGTDAMILGEARFHTCLEAEAWDVSLLLPGHFASERFAVNALAGLLSARFPDVQVWASHRERDPLTYMQFERSI